MKVSIIVFTLNEIDGMKAMMPQIKREWYDELIIVDGGSTDGTIEYARENEYSLFVQSEKGAAAGILEAMEKITGEITILFAPDGNEPPELIPKMVEKIMEGNDIVTVSRYRDGAKSYDDDIVTAFGNRMFTWLYNLLFGAGVTDALSGYMAFRTKTWYELGISNTAALLQMLTIRAYKNNKKLAEIAGDEPPRIGGIRKMKPFRDGLVVLRVYAREFFRPIGNAPNARSSDR